MSTVAKKLQHTDIISSKNMGDIHITEMKVIEKGFLHLWVVNNDGFHMEIRIHPDTLLVVLRIT